MFLALPACLLVAVTAWSLRMRHFSRKECPWVFSLRCTLCTTTGATPQLHLGGKVALPAKACSRLGSSRFSASSLPPSHIKILAMSYPRFRQERVLCLSNRRSPTPRSAGSTRCPGPMHAIRVSQTSRGPWALCVRTRSCSGSPIDRTETSSRALTCWGPSQCCTLGLWWFTSF